MQTVAAGAHPFHHRCLELYSCLASACRVCARLGAGLVALRRATLYGLLQAAAAEAMLAVGESHGHDFCAQHCNMRCTCAGLHGLRRGGKSTDLRVIYQAVPWLQWGLEVSIPDDAAKGVTLIGYQ